MQTLETASVERSRKRRIPVLLAFVILVAIVLAALLALSLSDPLMSSLGS